MSIIRDASNPAYALGINSSGAAKVTILDSDGNAATGSLVSTVNSSAVALAGSATFTGTAEDVHNYASLIVSVKTDLAGTLYVDFSTDGSNWDSTLSYSVAAATNEVHRSTISKKYARIRFTNGSGSAQSYLRLQTMYGSGVPLTSPMNQPIGQDADAIIAKSADPYTLMAAGLFTGYSTVNKFGKNADIDIGTEDVWAGGGTWVAPTTARVHNIVSSDANDTAAGTGARTVTIYGLDANYVLASETVTMNGVGAVATSGSYTIIHRMLVATAGSGGTNAGTITATAQTDATVTITIVIGKGQSQLGVYQVPASKTAYILNYYGSIYGGTSLDLELFIKPFGGVFNLKHTLGLTVGGNSSQDYSFIVPMQVTEKSIIKLTGTATANNTVVSGGFDLILIDN